MISSATALRIAAGATGDVLRTRSHPFDDTAGRGGARRPAAARRLVHDIAPAHRKLARRDRQLHALVRDGGATLRTIATRGDSLEETLSELPGTITGLNSGLGAFSTRCLRWIARVDALRPLVGDPAQGADRTSAQSAPTPNRQCALSVSRSRRLAPLARVVPRLADDLSRATTSLRPQVSAVDHATASAARCTTAIQRFFQWTPSVFKLGDQRGPGPRADATVRNQHLRVRQGAEGVRLQELRWRIPGGRTSRTGRHPPSRAESTMRGPIHALPRPPCHRGPRGRHRRRVPRNAADRGRSASGRSRSTTASQRWFRARRRLGPGASVRVAGLKVGRVRIGTAGWHCCSNRARTRREVRTDPRRLAGRREVANGDWRELP